MRTILVVDDDAGILEVVGLMLEEEGYRVVAARDGLEGLRLAQRERPDLVLTDVAMPRLPGPDLARRLHEDPDLADTPVVLMSATLETAPRLAGLPVAYLPKPFSMDTLLRMVGRHVRGAAT